MFRSLTIIREIALNLAKVMYTLKHSVKLCRYLLCGCVYFNPLPSLTLQSARDLNVPCWPKRSKALLLSSS